MSIKDTKHQQTVGESQTNEKLQVAKLVGEERLYCIILRISQGIYQSLIMSHIESGNIISIQWSSSDSKQWLL